MKNHKTRKHCFTNSFLSVTHSDWMRFDCTVDSLFSELLLYISAVTRFNKTDPLTLFKKKKKMLQNSCQLAHRVLIIDIFAQQQNEAM